ncbi:hypothetical protein HPB48_008407 [Haemaphysalis longicornis]|uniref:Anhydro-N-acetylmuramic acid kinase n=1 Tax=Haemaphysalis longicornis TaxID=44386 RepID=A0A9J6H2J5_HAELO|nr:hypothetical protein HPB48_008407 [Haemaphysalis longicornis]
MPDYRVIGVMSGSSLDGLDIIYVTFHVTADAWKYKIGHAVCKPYAEYWANKLQYAVSMNALEYQLFHTEYGRYLGDCVNLFIRDNQLEGKVDLVACHGHTVFHLPGQMTTTQVGDGAAVAAVTGLPTVSDFRSVDVALQEGFAEILGRGLRPRNPLPTDSGSRSVDTDAMRTFTAHICNQAVATVQVVKKTVEDRYPGHCNMLVTGGGARNTFLVQELTKALREQDITLTVPEDQLVDFKEALMTAALGVLRLREEVSFFSKVSGATRNSVGAALWSGAPKQA